MLTPIDSDNIDRINYTLNEPDDAKGRIDPGDFVRTLKTYDSYTTEWQSLQHLPVEYNINKQKEEEEKVHLASRCHCYYSLLMIRV